MQDHRDLMNDFDWAGKTKQPATKLFAFGPKMTRIEKIFKKILRFFDQNLYVKLTFFTVSLLNISWISDSAPKVYIDLWKITTDFYNNFSDFGGGDVPAFPLPTLLHLIYTFNLYICTIHCI